MPLVSFEVDVFDYWYFVEIMNSGQTPKFDVLPGGFPVFLYLIGLVSNKAITVAIIQNLITLFSSLFLIVAIDKYYKSISVVAAIGLTIFVNGKLNIQFDNSYNPESIYINSIIIVVGMLLFSLHSQKKIWWILLSISLIFPAVIRSNGIFIYFIIPLIIVYFIIKKSNLNFYLWFFIPFMCTNILWASYNYFTAGIFMISNPTRIMNIFSDNPKWGAEMILNDTTFRGSTGKPDKSFKSAVKYFFLFSAKKSPYYYTYLSQRYHEMYVSEIVYKEYAAFDGAIEVPESWKRNAMKEYYKTQPFINCKNYFSFYSEKQDSLISSMSLSEIKNITNNNWIFLTFLFQILYELFIFNSIWLYLYIICFLISLYMLVHTKYKNEQALFTFILISIHLISIIVITLTHGYSLASSTRYEYTTEFSIFLAPFFVIQLLKSTGIINKFLNKLPSLNRTSN